MLFSEPKIPQFQQRLNRFPRRRAAFQCSSASRKFLNSRQTRHRSESKRGFSALQRAENSSIQLVAVTVPVPLMRFSALQRAENSSIHTDQPDLRRKRRGFSALQRAENFSIENARIAYVCTHRVSVLFSEPKIPQSN